LGKTIRLVRAHVSASNSTAIRAMDDGGKVSNPEGFAASIPCKTTSVMRPGCSSRRLMVIVRPVAAESRASINGRNQFQSQTNQSAAAAQINAMAIRPGQRQERFFAKGCAAGISVTQAHKCGGFEHSYLATRRISLIEQAAGPAVASIGCVWPARG
jgi:hypothetical protein